MAKKSSLQLRKLSPDLLGRVNAYIELLGKDREEFFVELLDDLTKELKPVQERIKRIHEAKKSQQGPRVKEDPDSPTSSRVSARATPASSSR